MAQTVLALFELTWRRSARLDRLAGDPDLRSRLGGAAARAVAPYRPDQIVQQWSRLFENVAVAHTQREA